MLIVDPKAEAKVYSCESKAKLSWVFFSSIDILRSDKRPLGALQLALDSARFEFTLKMRLNRI